MSAVNIQIEVHPRYPQTQLRSFCRHNNIAVVAYSSLGVGDLFNHPDVMQIATECQRTSAQVRRQFPVCALAGKPSTSQ